ncbi:hypothetical protein LOCC1_G008548 [Lachnellula occidentalis]|uniref:Uncharacterized protein n=1 Tax=Lachnellula occidentalis TaxID=215460 RepID=A0A8H8U3F5_9HELO|nr:hypothetical protein LOCC1_G008548 [Lachnellula occidentalis]
MISTYDLYLLIDNTLILGTNTFLVFEEEELTKVDFKVKPKEKLAPRNPLIFNSYVLIIKDSILYLY